MYRNQDKTALPVPAPVRSAPSTLMKQSGTRRLEQAEPTPQAPAPLAAVSRSASNTRQAAALEPAQARPRRVVVIGAGVAGWFGYD